MEGAEATSSGRGGEEMRRHTRDKTEETSQQIEDPLKVGLRLLIKM